MICSIGMLSSHDRLYSLPETLSNVLLQYLTNKYVVGSLIKPTSV